MAIHIDDPRSGCPINLTVQALGDRWSLVVIRDIMFGNRRHFRELLAASEEGIASNILADRLKRLVERVPCYGHVKTFVFIDRDGVVTADANVEPWHKHAVARAIATRGKSFLEGITDHLISNYIRGLEGEVGKKQTGVRRRSGAE